MGDEIPTSELESWLRVSLNVFSYLRSTTAHRDYPSSLLPSISARLQALVLKLWVHLTTPTVPYQAGSRLDTSRP